MFCLKQYDTVLLTFDIKDLPLEGQKCKISAIYEENKCLTRQDHPSCIILAGYSARVN